jgi:predicted alpha-1,2-mannosidase
MRKRFRFVLVGSCIACVALAREPQVTLSPMESVNVFTGTSNSRWMMFPGATVPFGLVKLSPDNQASVWNGGYEWTVGSISGFSHLHAFGMSGLSLMPITGPVEYNPDLFRVFPGSPDGPFGIMWTSGYRSRIDKSREKGAPGYYAAELIDFGIQAEVTATARCGMLRFGFPTTEEAHVLLDFAFQAEELVEIRDAQVKLTAPNEISGSIRQFSNYPREHTLHFVVQTSEPLVSMDGWVRGASQPPPVAYGPDWQTPVDYRRGIEEFKASGRCGVSMNFKTESARPLLVRTGVSLVSLEGARKNLEMELAGKGWDFDRAVADTRATWNDIVGQVEVEGGSARDREMFYTALYRTFAAKPVLSDADGSYRDVNGVLRKLERPDDGIFSSDAFWGSQWTIFPVWTLLAPKHAATWTRFLLQASRNGGWIPQAPVNGGYGDVMGAQHQIALIISCFQKGIHDFDTRYALEAIHHDLTTQGVVTPQGGFAGNKHMQAYMDFGYVPDEVGSQSNTFEYAFNDWMAGQFALALGDRPKADYFLRRSENWRHAIDPSVKYARRRHQNGTWVEPFDPYFFGSGGAWNGPGFMEGTAWLFTWYVPQNLGGLIEVIGRDLFLKRLEDGFNQGRVDLGNEPNMQAPFLFNYAGQPWRTQYHTRKSLDEIWDPSPLRGWHGEEDEGQLSALYVLWAMGLFQMDGGCSVRTYYDLTSPLFSRIKLKLDPAVYHGHTFEIVAHGNSAQNRYIQSARLNGKPLNRAWIYHDELVAGGLLEFEMGAEPNTTWATGPESAPPLLKRIP